MRLQVNQHRAVSVRDHSQLSLLFCLHCQNEQHNSHHTRTYTHTHTHTHKHTHTTNHIDLTIDNTNKHTQHNQISLGSICRFKSYLMSILHNHEVNFALHFDESKRIAVLALTIRLSPNASGEVLTIGYFSSSK